MNIQTSFENMAFTLHQIMVMKRLLSFINLRIAAIERTHVSDWKEYANLRNARDCYTENIWPTLKVSNN